MKIFGFIIISILLLALALFAFAAYIDARAKSSDERLGEIIPLLAAAGLITLDVGLALIWVGIRLTGMA